MRKNNERKVTNKIVKALAARRLVKKHQSVKLRQFRFQAEGNFYQ